jgi:hypothetical protein
MWPAVDGSVLGTPSAVCSTDVLMIGTLPGVRSAPGLLVAVIAYDAGA